jgi:hypothetical protein
MAVVGLLTLIVCILGLIVYLALTAFSKASFIEVGRICFAMGLLAFLIAQGASSCSIGTNGASSNVQHR